MKDLMTVQDYLLDVSEVGDWDGEEEQVADTINTIIHAVWDALPETLSTEKIDQLMPQFWQQLGGDSVLLDVDEHELIGWALTHMRQQIELGIDDAEQPEAESADVDVDYEEE
ncbi:hypothetical protein VT06_00805 [Arsukibacterium sp. MJ3]|jgi:hypothetical protein|uniref:hypothetical protein n=1 Tax=Arsukibacterium sp. MJ3 TaxID=1632859 RepID=UPI0006270DE5|nr:hypothetical protein [Arsukibacterium sp. MJ3]KKO50556.1 hypothetical protein VT06_00805 [Arsukibacterium sp. MJ3]